MLKSRTRAINYNPLGVRATDPIPSGFAFRFLVP